MIVKNNIAKGASDEELKFCLTVARRYRLDPFKQQIWFVRRWDKEADNGKGGKGNHVWTPQVGINGLLMIANRDHQKEFGSVSLPEFGPIITVEGNIKAPEWARVKVWKKGEEHPTESEAWWTEYAPSDLSKAPFWRKMPRRMIGKCATALALRQSYPDLGGLYISEECERMTEDYTPEGRQIIEQGGSISAAVAVADRKLAAHAEGKTIDMPGPTVEVKPESVTLTPYKEGFTALTGKGLNILKSEMTEEDKEGLDIRSHDGKVWAIPNAHVFSFQDRCAKYKVEVIFAETERKSVFA